MVETLSAKPRILVDVMGADPIKGDNPLDRMLAGVLLAVQAGYNVAVVGDSDQIGTSHGLTVIHAPEEFAMTDKIPDFKAKKNASVRVAARNVRAGEAAGMVSMGHSGGTVYAGHIDIGRIKGVRRGVVAAVFPHPSSDHRTVLLDVGGNADTEAEWIGQWAHLGVAYAAFLGIAANPTVSYLSIGEEPGKGSTFDREARTFLETIDLSPGILSEENAQGGDPIGDRFDVILTDGSTGNKILKANEALALGMMYAVLKSLQKTLGAMEALGPVLKKLNPDNHGGGVLLGVDAPVVIGHGKAKKAAVFSAIKLASDMAEQALVATIREKISPKNE